MAEPSRPADLPDIVPDSVGPGMRLQRAVVVGGGIAGLVAARDLVHAGIRVTLIESADRVGGQLRAETVGGVRVDVGAESYATRGGHVDDLVESLGLSDQRVSPNPAGAWLRLPGPATAQASVPLPVGGVLGIPSNPFAEDVRRAIGWSGAWRAYLDRLLPILTIGKVRNLGSLVTKRMGRRVRDRLVFPVTGGVYSTAPEDLDVVVAAPGLNGALTRTGSLSGAVADLRAGSKPGAAVRGLSGGMTVLTDALAADLTAHGAEIIVDAEATLLRHGAMAAAVLDGLAAEFAGAGAGAAARVDTDADAGAGADTATEADAGGGADTEADADAVGVEPSSSDWSDTSPATFDTHGRTPPSPTSLPHDGWLVGTADGRLIPCDVVLLACPERHAAALLDDAGRGDVLSEGEPATRVDVVTLVVDAPALDSQPRGSGVLVSAGARVGAKAMTHTSAKWEWLAESLPDGRHALRLSYGRHDDDSVVSDAPAQERRRQALADASDLLGVELDEGALADEHWVTWRNARPVAALGAAERRTAITEAIASIPGLDVSGAWIGGTGIASVVPDALAAAQRLRHAVFRRYVENESGDDAGSER